MSRSRSYCFTLNNYTYLPTLTPHMKYLLYGREIAPTTLTPHLQGFVYYWESKSLSQVRSDFPGAHLESTRGSIAQNIEYCKKEGDFVEQGTPPKTPKEKGLMGAEAIAARWELAKAGEFDLLPPEQLRSYRHIYSLYRTVVDRVVLDNIWIWGPSGSGKSKYCRDVYPGFFPKPMSKWWDGYVDQSVVVLDDYAPEHSKYLTYFLKVWSDHYAFMAETKGGSILIRPATIIVTSQYSIEECFEDYKSISAITRRFTVITTPSVPSRPERSDGDGGSEAHRPTHG